MAIRRILLALALLLATVVAGEEPLRLELDLSKAPLGRTDWYGVYVQGKKSGFAAGGVARKGDHYVVGMKFDLKLTAMGQEVEMRILQEERFDAAPPHAFRGGRFFMGRPGASQENTVERNDGKLRVQMSAAGQVREMEAPLPDYTLADALSQRGWIAAGPAVGDEESFRAFDLMTVRPFVLTFKVTKVEKTVVHGVPTTCYTGLGQSSIHGPTGVMRMSGDGDLLSNVMGGMFEMRLEPEDVAKKTEKGGDVFVQSMVRLDKPLGDPRKVVKLTLEVSGEGSEQFSTGPRQSVEAGPAEGARVVRMGPDQGGKHPATEAEIEENLQETVEYPVSHADIQALAKEAVGDAATPREKVDRLVQFVHKYVEDDLRPEPLSVLEVVQSKRGDCQEHAILFTTLARAAGVPARGISGLVYVGDAVQAFGGHAWNEVVLDGHWVPVDPTWNETVLDAAHIRVGSGLRGLTQMAWALGQVKLKLVAVERAD